MVDALVGAPVFPPIGPYSSVYVPQPWNHTPPYVLYTPNVSDAVNSVMSTVGGTSFVGLTPRGFASEKDLVAFYEADPMGTWAGVVFEAEAPNWRYTIRINGSFAPPSDPAQQHVRRGHLGGAAVNDWVRYFQTGFLLLQFNLDQAIAQEASKETYQPVQSGAPFDMYGSWHTYTRSHIRVALTRANCTPGLWAPHHHHHHLHWSCTPVFVEYS